jgi:hypothetical protein
VREDGLGGGWADEEGHAEEPEGSAWAFHGMGMDVRSAGHEVALSMDSGEIQGEGDAKWRMRREAERVERGRLLQRNVPGWRCDDVGVVG